MADTRELRWRRCLSFPFDSRWSSQLAVFDLALPPPPLSCVFWTALHWRSVALPRPGGHFCWNALRVGKADCDGTVLLPVPSRCLPRLLLFLSGRRSGAGPCRVVEFGGSTKIKRGGGESSGITPTGWLMTDMHACPGDGACAGCYRIRVGVQEHLSASHDLWRLHCGHQHLAGGPVCLRGGHRGSAGPADRHLLPYALFSGKRRYLRVGG